MINYLPACAEAFPLVQRVHYSEFYKNTSVARADLQSVASYLPLS